jgi:hypothetical protein
MDKYLVLSVAPLLARAIQIIDQCGSSVLTAQECNLIKNVLYFLKYHTTSLLIQACWLEGIYEKIADRKQ